MATDNVIQTNLNNRNDEIALQCKEDGNSEETKIEGKNSDHSDKKPDNFDSSHSVNPLSAEFNKNIKDSCPENHQLLSGKLMDSDKKNGGIYSKQEEKEIDENEATNVPQDTGWSWVILLACFIVTFTMSLYDQVLAVMFVDVVDRFEVTVTTASIAFTVHAVTQSVGSVISTNMLVPYFNDRKVITTAALVNCLATIVVAFSPHIALFHLLHFWKGFSIGCMWIPAMGLLGHYFKERRSLANALALTGIGVSLLVVPPFVRLLVDNFGFQGTLLLVSGFEMHSVPTSMLLRPISAYNKLKPKKYQNPASNITSCQIYSENNEKITYDKGEYTIIVPEKTPGYLNNIEKPNLLTENNKDNYQLQLLSNSKLPGQTVISNLTNMSDAKLLEKQIDSTLPVLYDKYEQSDEHEKKYNLGDKLDPTYLDHFELTKSLTNQDNEYKIAQDKLNNEDNFESCKMICKTRDNSYKPEMKMDKSMSCSDKVVGIFDWRLLSNWLVRIILLSTALGALVLYIPAYIPTLAVRRGVSKPQAAMLLTVTGGVSLLSSLLQGFVVDCKIMSAAKLIVIAQLVVGSMCHLVHLFSSFPTLVLLSVTYGLFGGARMSLMPVVVIDWLDVSKLSKTLGFNAMVATLSLSLHHPFLGFLLERSGTFSIPFHYVGLALYVSSALFMLEPLAKRLNNKNQRQMLKTLS